MSLSLALATYPSFLLNFFNPKDIFAFPITIFTNLLIVGAIYSLIYALIIAIKNRKKFVKPFIEVLKIKFKLQIIILAILGFISGLLEGIGINALIPLFAFIVKDQSQTPDIITRTIQKTFEMLHIPFNIVFLLLLIALLFIFKSIVLYIANYINIKITTEYDRKMKNFLEYFCKIL